MQFPSVRDPLRASVVGTVLAAAAGARLGLRGVQLRSGLRLGLTSAAVVTAAIASSTAIPAVRAGMAARSLPRPAWKWLLVDIPLGTVWPEETLYRGALGTVVERIVGPQWGRLLQATVFGLSHIPNARGTGEPVVPTVLATGAAGWVFGWLATSSGSLVAPALAHLAINEAGAVAALLVARGGHVPAVGLE